jgi:hypothetical protein
VTLRLTEWEALELDELGSASEFFRGKLHEELRGRFEK